MNLVFFLTVILAAAAAVFFATTKTTTEKQGEVTATPSSSGGLIIFTPETLAPFDGSDPAQPIYLVVVGEVFDVTDGRKYYAKGEGYNIFCGRDSSRAFMSGIFEIDKADASLDGLSPSDVKGIVGWGDFYRTHATYKRIGVLHGLYYDALGNPTEVLNKVRATVASATMVEVEEEKLVKLVPMCDVKSGSDFPDVEYKCPEGWGILRTVTWNHRGTGKQQTRCGCANFARTELAPENLPPDVTLTPYSICEDGAVLCNIPKAQHGV